MSREHKYSEETFTDVNPIEHIRIRPAMYIGRIDERGNLEIVKGIFGFLHQCSVWNSVDFVYLPNSTFQITFDDDLQFELSDTFFTTSLFAITEYDYLLQLVVGLSEMCVIQSKGKEFTYDKGVLIAEKRVLNSSTLSITFKFDVSILKSEKLPKYLLLNFFKRYSFLHPKREIHVFENETTLASFSSNGMQDWFDTFSFDAELLMQPFYIFIEDKTIDLKAEIVFSIHSEKESFSTIVIPRYDFVKQNGTHTEGFVKGLNATIHEILGEDYDRPIFSEYCNPLGVFKLSCSAIEFQGPTRDKVGNEEFLEIFERQTKEKLLANSSFQKAILSVFGM